MSTQIEESTTLDRLADFYEYFTSDELTNELIDEMYEEYRFPKIVSRVVIRNVAPWVLKRAETAGKNLIGTALETAHKNLTEEFSTYKRLTQDILEIIEAKISGDLEKKKALKQRMDQVTEALLNPEQAKVIVGDVEHFSQYDSQQQAWIVFASRFEEISEKLDEIKELISKKEHTKTIRAKGYPIPELPQHYLIRESQFNELKDSILTSGDETVGIVSASKASKASTNATIIKKKPSSAGLLGMGGVGKSVLTAALARDEDIIKSFPDGIVWLKFGRQANVVNNQFVLAEALGADSQEYFQDWETGRNKLSAITSELSSLIVLDDVWEPIHAEAFTGLGKNCRLLVTTRNISVLKKVGAYEHRLDTLTKEQALALLASNAGYEDRALPLFAHTIATRCGNLPIALAMAGALIQDDTYIWEELLERLEHADIKRLRALLPDCEHDGVLTALKVSVDALDVEHKSLFLQCAVFPEDVTIPEHALYTLWSKRFPDKFNAREAAQHLVNRSLMNRNKETRQYQFHDLYYDFLKAAANEENKLAEYHQHLLNAYTAQCPSGWHSGPDDGYYFQQLAYHLHHSNQDQTLKALLLDYSWIKKKLETAGVRLLLSDYTHITCNAQNIRDIAVKLTHKSLRLSSQILHEAHQQLPSQLIGRLQNIENPFVKKTILQAKSAAKPPWILSDWNALNSPDGLLVQLLSGHTAPVQAVTVTPDGRYVVSGSDDTMLKIWDLHSGTLNRTLEGHTSSVKDVAITSDGRYAVSGSWDKTLKVWELHSGFLIKTLRSSKENASFVNAVAVTPDGRYALSCHWDNTLKFWDLHSGVVKKIFEGHHAVTVTPDGRYAVSGCADHTLKIWDLHSGTIEKSLEGHKSKIYAIAVTPDGHYIVSGSEDTMLKVWNLRSGNIEKTLVGHTGSVTDISVTPDGHYVLSSGADGNIKVWDLRNRTLKKTIERHNYVVNTVAVTPDGRYVVSGSGNGMLRVLDLHSDEFEKTSYEHTDSVIDVEVISDGRYALSYSRDETLKLRDLHSGAIVKTIVVVGDLISYNSMAVAPDGRHVVFGCTDGKVNVLDLDSDNDTFEKHLEGHTRPVCAVTVTLNGRYVVSGSEDNTLKVWDMQSGSLEKTLGGHTHAVCAIAVTPDERYIVSGSKDRRVKLWDLHSGTLVDTLDGHAQSVYAVAVTPDNRYAVSGSATLKVWDLHSGFLIKTLEGHTGEISTVAVTPDGRYVLSGSSDHTVKVWDLDKGFCVATFYGDANITTLAIKDSHETVVGDASGKVFLLRLIEGQSTTG